jgi:cytochrome c-type biogenesis protein CcmE
MKQKYKRFTYLLLALISVSIGVMLILSALKENIVFFYSPSDIYTKNPAADQRIRVGGLVVDGSIKQQGNHLEFAVTDNVKTIHITYDGIPPGLFREGQGMVAEGHMRDGRFIATNLLAKHDENYMPPEVADAIKKSGHWKEQK